MTTTSLVEAKSSGGQGDLAKEGLVTTLDVKLKEDLVPAPGPNQMDGKKNGKKTT